MPKLPKIPKGFSKHFTKMYNQAKAEDHSNDESVLQDIVDAVKSEDKRYD